MGELKKELTFFEATSIVAGCGIGGGVMAVPYLASTNGIGTTALIFAVAFAVSVSLHLMIAEVSCRNKESSQLVEVLGKYVFKGIVGKIALWIFFGTMAVTMVATLSAYVVGAADIIESLTGMPLQLAEALFFVVAAGVIFFGLKIMGICEKIAVAGILTIIAILIVATLTIHLNPLPTGAFVSNKAAALYGMIMFSFSAYFSVPQAAVGLSRDGKKVAKAVILGIALNMLIIIAITLCVLAASNPVTEVAIIGWSKGIGQWATLAGSLFVLLAMVTSYWATALACADIMVDRLKIRFGIACLIATLPSFLIAVVGFTGFLGFMRLAGGAIAILIAVLVIPTYRLDRKAHMNLNKGWGLGKLGSTPVLFIVMLGYLLMAYGSMVTI
jgi:amino acid permease